MLPKRLNNIRPYLASFIFSRFARPPFHELMRWLIQPGKEKRAACFLNRIEEIQDFREIWFKGYEKPFYYPNHARWIDLCQTIDECMNLNKWHNFITKETPLTPNDIVVDCGAAEGLFSFVASAISKKIYAIEPIPTWHPALDKTFSTVQNVQILKYGVGHKKDILNMTNDEIFSKVSSNGNIAIEIDTLDGMLGDTPITFIKADIEGFEFQMLLGAEKVIKRNRPKISLTVYHDGNDISEIMSFLHYLHSDYSFKTRGIAENGNPVLLTAY